MAPNAARLARHSAAMRRPGPCSMHGEGQLLKVLSGCEDDLTATAGHAMSHLKGSVP